MKKLWKYLGGLFSFIGGILTLFLLNSKKAKKVKEIKGKIDDVKSKVKKVDSKIESVKEESDAIKFTTSVTSANVSISVLQQDRT